MLNSSFLKKYFPVVLIRIRLSKPRFRITIPAALFVFTALLDCSLDILKAVNLFIPRRSSSSNGEKSADRAANTLGGLTGVIALLTMVRGILSCIGTGESFDLVNVEVEGVFVQIRV